MSAVMNRGRNRSAVVGIAAAAAGAALVLVLGGGGLPGAAQAAQVPVAQAACPVQADPAPLTRNTDAFAKIDGIAGDSTNAQHAREVALIGVRAGVFSGGAALCGGTGSTGRAAFDPMVIEKGVDRASVPLMGKAATGTRLKTVRITVSTTGATPLDFLTYDLSDVRVLSIRQVKRGNTLTEEVALEYTRVTYTYVPQNSDGSGGAALSFCFDVRSSSSC